MAKEWKIIGLDLGMNVSMCIGNDNGIIQDIFYKDYKEGSDNTYGKMLSRFAKDLTDKLTLYSGCSIFIVYESAVGFLESSKLTNYETGVVELYANNFGAFTSGIAPNTLKKFITGKGNCKSMVYRNTILKMIEERNDMENIKIMDIKLNVHMMSSIGLFLYGTSKLSSIYNGKKK